MLTVEETVERNDWASKVNATEEIRVGQFVKNALVIATLLLLSGVCLFHLSGYRYYLVAWLFAISSPVLLFILQTKLSPSRNRWRLMLETLLFCLFLFLVYCPAPSASGFSGDGLRCEVYNLKVEVGPEDVTLVSTASESKSGSNPSHCYPVVEVDATNARGQKKRILMAVGTATWKRRADGSLVYIFRRPGSDTGGFVLRKLIAVTYETAPRSASLFAQDKKIEIELDAPILHLRSILAGPECSGLFICRRIVEFFPSRIDEYWFFDEGEAYLQESDGKKQSFDVH